ncbi:MAG TPA: outer membrane protein assembly factor BamD [Bacteroidales bacterium]|nr:outer membrane protein assembly factor BamD [Bacteroidales bacterium]HRX97215.1 outer membrane protein assembly factor BamD [Bacteroidales bacterium]
MFVKRGIYFIISILALVSVSCSQYHKISKSQDYKFKYEKAMEYYEREDYFRALGLFDQVIPFYRGTEEAEDIAYKYAYAYYNQKEYIMASYYFDRFYKTYPRSERAEECMFMSAYCKYKESPNYKLDQTTTKEGISQLQLFINAYPTSERVEQCNGLIDELRLKLQMKEYEIAKLYLKMDQYEAAVTSFDNLLLDYPDSEFKEDAMFYTIKSYYYYASKSVRSKRKERYQEAADIYQRFVEQYPESKYMKEVAYMYNKAMKEIENN